MDDDGGQGYDAGTGEQSQGNPAWNEFLQVVPQELHPQVTPLLEKWDKGVNERFQKVHSEYEPWQPIVKSGVDPTTVQFGLNLINAIESDPYTVYSALQEHYGKSDPRFTGAATNGSVKPEQGQVEPTDNDPYQRDIEQLKQQQQILAQHAISIREKEIADKQDAVLDKELSDARSKYGEFDEEYVLAKMQNGMSADEAVQRFQRFVTTEAKKYAPKPLIMGTGRGIPNQSLDVKKMDDAGRRSIALQMLNAINAQDD